MKKSKISKHHSKQSEQPKHSQEIVLLEQNIMKEIIKAKISICFIDILTNGGCELVNIEGLQYFRLSENFLDNHKKINLLEMRLLAIEPMISTAEKNEVIELKSTVPGLLTLQNIIEHPYPEESLNGNGFGQGNVGILGLVCFGLPVSKKLVNTCILESAQECIQIVTGLVESSKNSCILYKNNIDYCKIIEKYKIISTEVLKNIGINDICGFRIEKNTTKDFFTSSNTHALLLTSRMSVKEAHDIYHNEGKRTIIGECLNNPNIFRLLFTDKLTVSNLIHLYDKNPEKLSNMNQLMKSTGMFLTFLRGEMSEEKFHKFITNKDTCNTLGICGMCLDNSNIAKLIEEKKLTNTDLIEFCKENPKGLEAFNNYMKEPSALELAMEENRDIKLFYNKVLYYTPHLLSKEEKTYIKEIISNHQPNDNHQQTERKKQTMPEKRFNQK